MFSPENICAGLQSPYVLGEHGRSSFPLSGRPKTCTLNRSGTWDPVLPKRRGAAFRMSGAAMSALRCNSKLPPLLCSVNANRIQRGLRFGLRRTLWGTCARLVRLVRRARKVVEARRLQPRWYILRLLWQWCRRETARRGTIHTRSALLGVWGRLVRAVLVTIRVAVSSCSVHGARRLVPGHRSRSMGIRRVAEGPGLWRIATSMCLPSRRFAWI